MKTYELVVPCHFGLEAVLKREIYDLGLEHRICVCRSSMHSIIRSAEKCQERDWIFLNWEV